MNNAAGGAPYIPSISGSGLVLVGWAWRGSLPLGAPKSEVAHKWANWLPHVPSADVV